MKLNSRRLRRVAAGLGVVAASVALSAVPARADDPNVETGTANCGLHVGYVQVYFKGVGSTLGPGSSGFGFWNYYPDVTHWHVQQADGGTSGSWQATGYPTLYKPNTYAGCRTYT